MSKILAYIGLHFKLSFKRDKKNDIKSSIITFVLGLLTCVVVLFLSAYLFKIINKQILIETSPAEFSVLLFTIIEVVLIVIGVFLEVKFFLKPNDIHITARFPLSSTQLFIAQLLIVYIYLFAFSFSIIMPLMIVFGYSVGIISVSFIFQLIFASFFAPLIPFAVATIFAVPIMYILTKLENKNIIKLIIFLIFLTVAFFAYSRILNFLAEYYVHQRVDAQQKNLVIEFINKLNNGWNFFGYVNNLVFGKQIFKSVGIIISSALVISAIGILIAIPLYSAIRRNILEGQQSIFSKKSEITQESAFCAIFKNDFRNIFRTHVYSYFYLGISIVTPIMIILTNSLIKKVGTAQIGSSTVFGISLLIVLVFMSMINSFPASAISREGKEFYITKIVPVSYEKQLLAKGLLNILVSFGASVISIIILCSMKSVDILQGFIIFITSMIFSCGIILNGFNINVRFPHINKSKAGEESQTNTTITMFIGFIINAVEALVAIVLTYFIKMEYIYLILIGISIIYAIINILLFHFTINKKYSEIE